MRIVELRATPVYVPMRHPLRWSLGVEPGLTRVVVELVTDEGLVGLGESNGGAALLEALEACRPFVVGLDPFEVSKIPNRFAVYRFTSEQLSRTATFKLAGAAIEMACWDLVGKITGRPCGDLWGGIVRDRVEFAAYVFYRYQSLEEAGEFSDPSFVADYAISLCNTHGFRDVKLKNGVLEPELEVETVRLIRQRGAGVVRNIRIDPNQAWSVPTSIRLLSEFGAHGIEFCEDPTWGMEGMARVRERSQVSLATNMCCISFDQIPEAVRTRPVDVILGDMHFWGGPTALTQLAKLCDIFGFGLSLHSDRELGISTAAILHFAASQPMVTYAIDSHLPEQDGDVITEPFQFRQGCLDVPRGPGLGVELDRDALETHHRSYLERGERDEFQDELRQDWHPMLPLW
jgi:glucarate dehydratase